MPRGRSRRSRAQRHEPMQYTTFVPQYLDTPPLEDCYRMDQDKPDFDDLFEPFELGETPPEPETPRRQPPPPAPKAPAPAPAAPTHAVNSDVPTVPCPSCGVQNPDYNRHCEQCGARLSQDPLPVAPAPNLRTSPGGRALGVLGAVVLLVALAALIFNVFRGGDDVADTSTTTSSATTVPVAAVELFPASVEASSFLNGHDPEHLIDDDPDTDWNDDGARGVDAWLRFSFTRPVRITEIELQNLFDDDRFKKNYKIQGYLITTDDLTIEISGRLANTNDPQRIPIASIGTTELTIAVKSTYPAEPAGDRPPFNELALQSVRVFGSEG